MHIRPFFQNSMEYSIIPIRTFHIVGALESIEENWKVTKRPPWIIGTLNLEETSIFMISSNLWCLTDLSKRVIVQQKTNFSILNVQDAISKSFSVVNLRLYSWCTLFLIAMHLYPEFCFVVHQICLKDSNS